MMGLAKKMCTTVMIAPTTVNTSRNAGASTFLMMSASALIERTLNRPISAFATPLTASHT